MNSTPIIIPKIRIKPFLLYTLFPGRSFFLDLLGIIQLDDNWIKMIAYIYMLSTMAYKSMK